MILDRLGQSLAHLRRVPRGPDRATHRAFMSTDRLVVMEILAEPFVECTVDLWDV